jgi:hypothetical protein
MATLITSQDMDYMKAFPADQKSKIMREIMSRSPVAGGNVQGNPVPPGHAAKVFDPPFIYGNAVIPAKPRAGTPPHGAVKVAQ